MKHIVCNVTCLFVLLMIYFLVSCHNIFLRSTRSLTILLLWSSYSDATDWLLDSKFFPVPSQPLCQTLRTTCFYNIWCYIFIYYDFVTRTLNTWILTGQMAQVEDVRYWCERYRAQTPSGSNLPHVANNSPLLQPRSVGPGAKLRRWAPLTRYTRKDFKRVW